MNFKITLFVSAIVLSTNLLNAQESYTILRVNDSNKQSIDIEIKGHKYTRSRGDIIRDNEKICWKKNDILEVYSNGNGQNYTFRSTPYYDPKNAKIREKFAYIKYMRTGITVSKGVINKRYDEYTDIMINDTLKVCGFNNILDDSHYYELTYVTSNDSVIHIKAKNYDNKIFYVTKQQLENAGVDTSKNPVMFWGVNYKNEYEGSNNTVIGTLMLEILY